MLSPRNIKKKETHSVSSFVFREKELSLCPLSPRTGGRLAFSLVYS